MLITASIVRDADPDAEISEPSIGGPARTITAQVSRDDGSSGESVEEVSEISRVLGASIGRGTSSTAIEEAETVETHIVTASISRAQTGAGIGGGQELIEVAMIEDVPAFVLVTATGERADSSDPAHRGKVAGMTLQSYTAGQIAQLADDDEVVNPSWSWSPGTKLFLNGTNISATPPASGFSQMIGVARNANIIILQLGPPIQL